MRDSRYFPHDFNASRDEKLVKLRMDHGWLAVGLYWGVIEQLYDAGGSVLLDIPVLAYTLTADATILESVVRSDLFYITTENRLCSHSVDRRMKEINGRREAAKISGSIGGTRRAVNAGERVHNTPSNIQGTLKAPLSDPQAINESKVNESKVNESKVTTTRFIPPTIEQVQAYCFERGKGINPEAWMAHYQANGWKVGKNPMKDWRAAVRTWEGRQNGGPGGSGGRRAPGLEAPVPGKYAKLGQG